MVRGALKARFNLGRDMLRSGGTSSNMLSVIVQLTDQPSTFGYCNVLTVPVMSVGTAPFVAFKLV
jgi:hypothetical protein